MDLRMKLFLLIHTLIVVITMTNAAGGGNETKSGVKGHSGDTENTKILRSGYPLTLECKIMHGKDEKVELIWLKGEEPIKPDSTHYKISQENSTLAIASASMEDVGEYRCITVNMQPAQSFNISVISLAFKNMQKSKTVLQGDELKLICEVDGKPMPSITWLQDQKDVESVVNSSRYQLESNANNITNATFIISSAEYVDRAEYACVIRSGGVRYNTTIYVRIKYRYAALWPFLGICAEVFILCVIIFVYERRRAKADFEESDTDQPSEQKNTAEHNRDSVRQRK